MIRCSVDTTEVLAWARALQDNAEQALKATMNDIRKRGPTWIAKGVAEDYGISAKEVTGGGVVNLSVRGSGFKDLTLQYTGRMLTPTHFHMTPTAPKPGRGGYTIKATIKKGNRATIGKVKKISKKQWANIGRNFTRQGTRNSPESPPMLSYTGNKKLGGTNFIPFQRTKQPGVMDKVIKTIAVPQMIKDGSGNLKPAVEEQLNTNIEKRFNHYVDRYLGR